MAKKNKRTKTITVRSYFDLDGMTFDGMLHEIKEVKKEFPDTFNHRFNVDTEYDYGSYTTAIIILASEYETDEEYDKRIEKAAKRKITDIAQKKKRKIETKEKELKQLAKLKEKYERQENKT